MLTRLHLSQHLFFVFSKELLLEREPALPAEDMHAGRSGFCQEASLLVVGEVELKQLLLAA